MSVVTAAKPISLRAYGRRRGVSLAAVQRAIDEGRLDRSVVRVNGDRKISDPELADREWEERTRAAPVVDPEIVRSRVRREVASARREEAMAELSELDLARRRGDLMSAADLEGRLVDVFVQCKTKLLGVPTQVRQRDPSLTAEQIGLIEDAIRDALEDLASAPAKVFG